MSFENTLSQAPQEGIMHGPWRPLSESGLAALEQTVDGEYDLTDIALQGLHQHQGNFWSIDRALSSRRVTRLDAKALWNDNQAAYDRILDRHLTR